jgi:glycosyltransferase involved in cell wall biosynthesis
MAEPIRVLELLVSTELGGGPAHVRDLVSVLPREAFIVTVAGPAGGPHERDFAALGAEFVGVRADRLSPRVLLRVIRLMRRRRIQVVHSHGKGPGLYGRLAARLTGARAIHTFHGIHYEGYPRLYLEVERRLARWSHTVVHVSESQARDATALGLAPPGRSRVIVNGIDLSRARATIDRPPLARRQLGLEAEDLVIGTVARFDPVKDLDVLLRAFARLLRDLHAARLFMVGNGPESARLRALAQDLGVGGRVVFAGPLPDAIRCLPLVDLYVSASRREGLPMALLEAMACERAVVATRAPGHVDAVEDGVTGLLVPIGDALALAEAAAVLLREPARRRALGEAGRMRVERHFTLARMGGEIAALYREAAGF